MMNAMKWCGVSVKTVWLLLEVRLKWPRSLKSVSNRLHIHPQNQWNLRLFFQKKNVNLNPKIDTLREDFATQFSVYPKTRYQSWCFWTFRITLTSSSLFWRSFSPISCISLRKQKLCNIRVTDFSDLDFKTQIHYFFIVVYLLLVRFWTIAVAPNLFFCDI